MDPDRSPATPNGRPAEAVEFATRLAELQLMLEILERARSTATDTRPQRFEGDPVALTQALHPDGLRRSRRSRESTNTTRSARGDTDVMPVRLFVFDDVPRT